MTNTTKTQSNTTSEITEAAIESWDATKRLGVATLVFSAQFTALSFESAACAVEALALATSTARKYIPSREEMEAELDALLNS